MFETLRTKTTVSGTTVSGTTVSGTTVSGTTVSGTTARGVDRASLHKGSRRRKGSRRGATLALAALMLIVAVSMLAFALDLGYLAVAQTELQRTADATAIATGWALLDERLLKSHEDLNDLHGSARAVAARYTALNRVCSVSPVIGRNESKSTSPYIS
ncbi:hypothetical protein LCGC14_3092530 [marine sediment metagenome]|uniref:Putative Flp pilus-assembly TadG-like N-terminal domain-containing protein n=1 Tax=marine sediment metagenome TaxID=412755 RepID=A0A0F8WAK6_9ZZZZ